MRATSRDPPFLAFVVVYPRQVVRDTHEIAWEATVYGTYPCPSYPCDRTEVHGFDQPQGWAQYAVERFYDEPLVADASCAAGDAGASLELSFTAWNQFKQNNPVRAAVTPSSLARRASPPPRRALRGYHSDIVVAERRRRGGLEGQRGARASRFARRRRACLEGSDVDHRLPPSYVCALDRSVSRNVPSNISVRSRIDWRIQLCGALASCQSHGGS